MVRKNTEAGYVKYKECNNDDKCEIKVFITSNFNEYIEKLETIPDENVLEYKIGKNIFFTEKEDD